MGKANQSAMNKTDTSMQRQNANDERRNTSTCSLEHWTLTAVGCRTRVNVDICFVPPLGKNETKHNEAFAFSQVANLYPSSTSDPSICGKSRFGVTKFPSIDDRRGRFV